MFNIGDVQLVEWNQVEPEPLGGDLAEDLGKIINKFIKYGLNDWWKQKRFAKENKYEYLSMRGQFDKVIKQSIYMAKTIATAVKFKFYNDQEVGHKLYVARDRYMKLLRSCLYHHCSNSGGGWGESFEQLPWATDLLFVCWLAWDKLNIRDKQYAVNILNSETQRAMLQRIEYDYKPDGTENGGESKAIYNLYNANLLYLVSVMCGKSKKSVRLREKAILTYRACFSSFDDSDMDGYNVGEDMIIRRNDTRSPFATASICKGIKAYIFSNIAKQELPSGAVRNFAKIYSAFYRTEVNEEGLKQGLFCVYDKKNRPCGGVMYPDGTRGGKVNESALYCMDIFAYCLGFENVATEDISSRDWAQSRMKLIEKNAKHNAKYSLAGCWDMRNNNGEAVCSELADCYVALFLCLVAKKADSSFVDKFSREEFAEN